MLILLISFVYFMVLFVRIFDAKGKKKSDYVKIFCLNFSLPTGLILYLLVS